MGQKSIKSKFFKFLGRLLPSTIGATIGFYLAFAIVIGNLISGVGNIVKEVEASREIKARSVLKLNLNANLVENYEYDPIEDIKVSNFGGERYLGLVQLKDALETAMVDDKIEGVFLNISDVAAGFAKIRELRTALDSFKTSGKFVVAYTEVMTEKALYLASVSDEIYLTPMGYMEFNGLSSQKFYLKGALEKLEIQPEIFKVGDFKSAVEPLIRTSMSDSSRLQTEVYLESIYNTLIQDIAISREVDAQQLRMISDSMYIKSGDDAAEVKLITSTAYFDQVEEKIQAFIGDSADGAINYVGLTKYRDAFSIQKEAKKPNQVAVIVAEGEIISGTGEEFQISSNKIITEIRKARNNDSIKAVILRVNSPGGSALASDVIWRELELTREKKPVITSMSDVAASGGYYIAAGTDFIMANPNTITGSIGVFGIMMNIDQFLENKLGITSDRVNTGAYSDFGSVNREMTDDEREIIQSEVEKIYDTFLKRVSDARGLTLEKTAALAKGRVWSGIDALEVGLVDSLGNLDDAINKAAALAGIADSSYQVVYFPEKKKFFEKVLEALEKEDSETETLSKVEMLLPQLKLLRSLANPSNRVQMRMPYELVIE